MKRYEIVKGALYALSLLPFPALYAISDFLCLFVRRFYRRGVVRENLQNAFPEKSEAERRDIERRFYRQFCDNFVEIVKSFSMSRGEMMRRMTFGGLEKIRTRHESGQPFHFMFLAHCGNWEWVASMNYHAGGWASCAQIYHHIYDKVMEPLFLDMRSRYGGESIEMKETFRRILQMRADGKNHTIGFISDQQPKWNSIHHFVRFLNQDTGVFTGGERIARKVDAFTTYGRITKPSRGHYHLEVVPIEDHPAQLPERTVTDRFFQLLEEDIRRCPELWLWTHKRWSRTKQEWLRRQGVGQEE